MLPFSNEQKAADKVKARVKALHGFPVTTGETRLRTRRFFARLETVPSTATEVLAETLPLAICRLALVVSLKSSQLIGFLALTCGQ